jgi:hypothetical protein
MYHSVYWMTSVDKTDRVIINLKVIATLKDGQRICMRNSSFSIQDAGWSQAFARWAYGETRWVNLDDIKAVVSDALRILGTYMTLVQHAYGGSPGHTEYATLPVPTPDASLGFVGALAKELQSARTGLLCLRGTYVDDSLMVANLDVLIERTSTEVDKALALLERHNLPPRLSRRTTAKDIPVPAALQEDVAVHAATSNTFTAMSLLEECAIQDVGGAASAPAQFENGNSNSNNNKKKRGGRCE